jgi:hypothetical protein
MWKLEVERRRGRLAMGGSGAGTGFVVSHAPKAK